MKLKNGLISIPSLLLGSLKIANKAFGATLGLIVLLFLVCVLLVVITFGISFVFGPKLSAIIQIPISLLQSILGLVFTVAIIQIVAAKIENTGLSVTESFTGSFIPAIYFFISNLLLVIPMALVIMGAIFSKSILVVVIVTIGLSFASLPFIFTLPIIALRGEGPISALRYSWDLGTKYYGRILLIICAFVLLSVFCLLAFICLLTLVIPNLSSLWTSNGQMATALPMYLLMLFSSTPKLYIIGGVIVLIALYIYAFLFVHSVWTALFLNLDYMKYQADEQALEISAAANFHQAQVQTPIPQAYVPEVSIKIASIHTQSDEDTTRHLEQVYKAQEHLSQALEQEEDRMPTILFDEDLARQLAETEQKMKAQQQESAKKKDDQEQQSIKMSDKPL